jgi:hypothetical protein
MGSMSQSMDAQIKSPAGQQEQGEGQAAGEAAPATAARLGDPDVPATEGQDAGQASPESSAPGFGERGGMRRRLRFLRKARELAYRDLGGLVFEMHRLGQRHDELVAAKLAMLDRIDVELRALAEALGERRSVTVLREAGIGACPRCATIHGSDDRFCPACGLPMGRHADRPIAAAPAGTHIATGAAAVGAPSVSPPAAPTPETPNPASAPASPMPASTSPTPASRPASPTPAPAPPTQAPAAQAPPSPAQAPAPPASESAPPVPPAGGRTTATPSSQEDRPTQIIRPPEHPGR